LVVCASGIDKNNLFFLITRKNLSTAIQSHLGFTLGYGTSSHRSLRQLRKNPKSILRTSRLKIHGTVALSLAYVLIDQMTRAQTKMKLLMDKNLTTHQIIHR